MKRGVRKFYHQHNGAAHLPLAIRLIGFERADKQHISRHLANNFFRNAANKDIIKYAATMTTHDDEVGAPTRHEFTQQTFRVARLDEACHAPRKRFRNISVRQKLVAGLPPPVLVFVAHFPRVEEPEYGIE